jgi:hypothetical protein
MTQPPGARVSSLQDTRTLPVTRSIFELLWVLNQALGQNLIGSSGEWKSYALYAAAVKRRLLVGQRCRMRLSKKDYCARIAPTRELYLTAASGRSFAFASVARDFYIGSRILRLYPWGWVFGRPPGENKARNASLG